MHKTKWILSLLFLVTCFIYLFQPENIEGVVANWSYFLVAISPGIFSFRLLWEYGFRRVLKNHVFFLTLGFSMFGLGNVFWTFVPVVSFPSIGDFFFLLGYPFIFIGLYQTVIEEGQKLHTIIAQTGMKAKITAIILIGVILYFGVYVTLTSGLSLLGTLFAITYNLGDISFVAMLLLLLQVAHQMKGGKLAHVWIRLGLGIFIILVADILYIFFSPSYFEGVWASKLIDLVWEAGYIGVALGFNYWTAIIIDVKNRLKIVAKSPSLSAR